MIVLWSVMDRCACALSGRNLPPWCSAISDAVPGYLSCCSGRRRSRERGNEKSRPHGVSIQGYAFAYSDIRGKLKRSGSHPAILGVNAPPWVFCYVYQYRPLRDFSLTAWFPSLLSPVGSSAVYRFPLSAVFNSRNMKRSGAGFTASGRRRRL